MSVPKHWPLNGWYYMLVGSGCLAQHRKYLIVKGPSWSWSYGSWIYNYLFNQCLSPLMLLVRISIRARCTTLCDNVYHWLATGRWLCQVTSVSCTNKTDRHDIAEILLKVALDTIKQTNKRSILMTQPE
jgi:hypothetical protein